MKKRTTSFLMILCFVLAACLPPPPRADAPPQAVNTQPPVEPTSLPSETPVEEGHSSEESHGAEESHAPHTDVLDVTRLILGDNRTSSSPQRGYVFSCSTRFGGPQAQGTGAWINGDGTWDLSKKITVDGSVSWPHSFAVSVQGSERVFTGNDLPDHATGNFPVSPSDDAYAIDRNPNSIRAQQVSFSIPAFPALAAQPTCVGGEVGFMLSGVVLFSAFDAAGGDAVAREVQDDCDGHPQEGGYYHYHSLSRCQEDAPDGHSALMGYAFDGFGIYGYYGQDGREVTNADLDECHGHSHEVLWEGQVVEMYHYHATREFPYVVGCFRGTPSVRGITTPGDAGQPQTDSGTTSSQAGQQPPQEAINACLNASVGAACTVNTPNGALTGTCQQPPNLQQLACVPAGGPPP